MENEEVKVLCDNVIETRSPDIILIGKEERKGIIIDISVPTDVKLEEKERVKMEKHQNLKREIGRLWTLKW